MVDDVEREPGHQLGRTAQLLAGVWGGLASPMRQLVDARIAIERFQIDARSLGLEAEGAAALASALRRASQSRKKVDVLAEARAELLRLAEAT